MSDSYEKKLCVGRPGVRAIASVARMKRSRIRSYLSGERRIKQKACNQTQERYYYGQQPGDPASNDQKNPP
jgi:hypothetical protein